MTPVTNNLYKTLGLLIMLKEQVRVSKEKLSDEEKATLQISRQVLKDSELTIPELVASAKWLDEKGYTKGFVLFDEHLRAKANEELDNISEEQMDKILSALDTPEKIGELKKAMIDSYTPILPPGIEFDLEAVESEDIKFSDIVKEGLSNFKKLRSDQVAVILVLPFRSISRLRKLIGEGIDPQDVKDEGVWYDSTNYGFHIGEEVIETGYRGRPNKEHYVLVKVKDSITEGVVWYDDINDHTPRSLKDALLRFIDNNKRLEDIFTVHSDRLEFSKEAFR
jgi:hypothetical protein